MRLLRQTIVVAAVVFGAACGGGGGGATGVNQPPSNTPPPGGGTTQTLGSIVVSSSQLSMTAGQSQTVSVRAIDTQGKDISGTGAVWASANSAIADVTADGLIIAISAGSAQINVSVTHLGVTRAASVTVAVTGALPTSASIVAGYTDYSFDPKLIVVRQGGTVTWTFGDVQHTVTFDGGAGAPSSIGPTTNQNVQRTFLTAGQFFYSCSIHYGMSGSVYVR
jgi:plastocyanin